MSGREINSYEFQKCSHYIPKREGPEDGIVRWPTEKIWPECKQKCVEKFYARCYRNIMDEK